ncbi:MAG: peptidylprolyl isomerase [Candidatus Krumholzibacteriota bacterium]|nr:peptidylprolyl isomerase [Candidatus Krumholzibacteriota bacterium]
MKGLKRVVFAAFFVALSAALSLPAEGEEKDREVIDRVVAIVQDRALLASDIEMEYQQLLMQLQKTSLPASEEKQKREEILDGLVSHLLLVVHAEKLGIEVAEERIESEVDRILNENIRAIGGRDALDVELAKAGITLEQLESQWREKIRANALIESLKYREGLMNEKVTEDDIRKYYREHYNEFEKRPGTVSLAQILIYMKAEKSAEEAAMAKIAEIQKRLEEGADFAETAKSFSEGPSAKYGGSLGFLKLEDLDNPRFEEAVRKLTVSEVSGPVMTEHGIHLIKLEEVSGDEIKLRHILIKIDTDVDATRAMAEKIREDIINGADFAEMARLYSEDWSTKEDGGNIGEIAVNRLPAFFLESIQGLKAGEIAPLVEEEKGFRIIKVNGWTEERPFNLDEARERIRDLIQRESFMKTFEDYVANLKEIYHVDIKSEEER